MDKSLLKKAAVIVLLDTSRGELILTQRTRHLSSHPGEICFPGGRCEEADCDLMETALRELHEELGIAPSRVHNLLALGEQTTLSGYVVSPWFGTVDSLMPCEINPDEVECIVPVDLREVLDKKNYDSMEIEREGWRIKTVRFAHRQHHIWGATADIMLQLCHEEKTLSVLREVLGEIEKPDSV